jgi:hypothetical protein
MPAAAIFQNSLALLVTKPSLTGLAGAAVPPAVPVPVAVPLVALSFLQPRPGPG